MRTARAITTKVLPATNTKGKRIKATDWTGQSVTLPFRENETEYANHRAACKAYIVKMQWDNICYWVAGCMKDGWAWVNVQASEKGGE